MGIIRQKLQETVDNNNNIRYSDTIAEITYYDNVRNTASIKFANPNNGSIMTATNVGIKISTGGLTQAALPIGQKCWISFIGNNLLTPVITNLSEDRYYDNVYSKKTNPDQGAYLVGSSVNTIDIESIKVTPMTEDYLNDSYSTKYSFVSEDYTTTDSTVKARDILMQIDKYKGSEDGITNTKTKSTIKFKDNGDIDIFVDNNTGIRINPTDKNISLFGKTIDTNITDTWTINGIVKINGSLYINDNEVI